MGKLYGISGAAGVTVGVIAMGMAVALVLRDLYGASESETDALSMSIGGAGDVSPPPPRTERGGSASVETASRTFEGPLPPHHVPASAIRRPPTPSMPVPVPRPPAEPSRHRPPLHNPGGVNGDRPERASPGNPEVSSGR